MKIVFMGTPDFAAGSLRALIAAGHEITLVVTQPDKEKGRGKKILMSPVKECAIEHNIPVFQPVKIKTEESVEYLRRFDADIFIVAAFGQILSKEILTMPRLGCVNVHASLLPKYRGAAPIQWCIIDGEKESGVTLMQMDEGLDTGDMLASVVVPISDDETGDSLHDKLMESGAKLLVDTLPRIESGEVTRIAQDDEKSCYAHMLKKELGHLDYTKDVTSLSRLIRGLNSWPSAYSFLDGKVLKIWEAACVYEKSAYAPGTIFDISKDSFCIACADGALRITSLQIEGKKRMQTGDFLRGMKLKEGTVLS